MQAAVILLVVFLITKDLAYAPFPYYLREIAEVICLISGIYVILTNKTEMLLVKYWPVMLYALVLFVSAPLSDYPYFVLLQIVSLCSVFVFFIAYCESEGLSGKRDLSVLQNSMLFMYGLVCLVSLILIKVLPGVAYEQQNIGNLLGYENRFRGLFSKSAGMGVAAGLFVGVAGIAVKRLYFKVPCLIIGVTCLLLTQSRTFWIAALVASLSTVWVYYPKIRRRVLLSMLLMGSIGGAFYEFKFGIDYGFFEKSARLDTVTNLTGRVDLWGAALQGFYKHPVFGYGFTLGGVGLTTDGVSLDGMSGVAVDVAAISKTTMHSGYLQVLLDAGVLGFLAYVFAIIYSVIKIRRNDFNKEFPFVFYGLIFLIISNMTESVIYSGAVFHSICFWALAIFSMSLTGDVTRAHQSIDGFKYAGINEKHEYKNLMN